jgi:sialidase-1
MTPLEANDGRVVWPVSDSNPRNGEGDVLELPDGTLFFAYTRFDAGGDEAPAVIRGAFSDDGGKSWRDEYTVQESVGRCNVMCVNLLTLQDGRVALVFAVKNGQEVGDLDCRPYIIYSGDSCATWSPPQAICTDVGRYYVLENSRLVQLSSGRIIVPLALLIATDPWWFAACCAYSDDSGATWRMSEFAAAMDRQRTGMVETGVVELDPERRQVRGAADSAPALLMYGRSCYGQILHCLSTHAGLTWSTPEPLGPRSPVSPSLIKRLPTGDLVLVWNAQDRRQALPEWRSPLTAAISRDEGQTWVNVRDIEPDISTTYCYPSLTTTSKDTVVLTYYRGRQRKGSHRNLYEMVLRVLDTNWFYE